MTVPASHRSRLSLFILSLISMLYLCMQASAQQDSEPYNRDEEIAFNHGYDEAAFEQCEGLTVIDEELRNSRRAKIAESGLEKKFEEGYSSFSVSGTSCLTAATGTPGKHWLADSNGAQLERIEREKAERIARQPRIFALTSEIAATVETDDWAYTLGVANAATYEGRCFGLSVRYPDLLASTILHYVQRDMDRFISLGARGSLDFQTSFNNDPLGACTFVEESYPDWFEGL